MAARAGAVAGRGGDQAAGNIVQALAPFPVQVAGRRGQSQEMARRKQAAFDRLPQPLSRIRIDQTIYRATVHNPRPVP